MAFNDLNPLDMGHRQSLLVSVLLLLGSPGTLNRRQSRVGWQKQRLLSFGGRSFLGFADCTLISKRCLTVFFLVLEFLGFADPHLGFGMVEMSSLFQSVAVPLSCFLVSFSDVDGCFGACGSFSSISSVRFSLLIPFSGLLVAAKSKRHLR